MRPVLLEIDGFASYKSKAVIDFRDTDFFALVGPTGSGKSTILDAIAFALYRSAPRWNDVGAVALALSPTANRAIVRLIFDANGKRYSVIRDVRRGGGKTQATSVREQRLERFHNADDDGTGETDVLESGNAVTSKVTELLGLNFQEFCTCVVLPQGDFSKFLHATSGERQAILKKLLGYQIYDNIRSAADSRARDHHANYEALSRHLESLGIVGESVIDELQHRVVRLEALEQRVNDHLLPAHGSATKAAADLKMQIDQVTAERRQLSTVNVPADVAELQQARTATAAAVLDAQAAESLADEDDQTARSALAGAPSRSELEQVKKQWAKLASVESEIPKLTTLASECESARVNAEHAAAQADTAEDAARRENDAAKVAFESASATADRTRTDLQLVIKIETPSGIAELAAQLGAANDALLAARQASMDAETADQNARDAFAAAPDAGTLTSAMNLAAQVAKALEDEKSFASIEAADTERLERAKTQVEKAETAVQDAEAKLQQASLSSHVHALRGTLAVGDDCPVCEQEVRTLPRPAEDVAATAAQKALSEAKSALRSAQDDYTKADREAAARAAKYASAVERAKADKAQLEELLADLGVEVGGLPQLTASRASLQDKATRAAARLRTARNVLKDAEAQVESLTEQRRSAVAALQTARDTVLPLGAPPVDDTDVAAAWGKLANWAADRAAQIAAELVELDEAAAQKHSTLTTRSRDLAEAESAAKRAAQARLDTALASQKADTDLSRAIALKDELSEALTQELDADSIEIQLKKVALLEAKSDLARSNLAKARAAVRAAQNEQKRAADKAAASWTALRQARDPLTSFGAPELGPETGDLLQAWTRLADWAATESQAKAEQLTALTEAAANATKAVEAAESAVQTALNESDLEGTTTTATKVLAREVAQAQSTLMRAQSDVEKARQLREDADREKSKEQVANELSRLMRSNNFPQWLVNSALDVLIGEASTVLFELSNRQFELTTRDGEIFVVDHNNADLTRAVKTLSGGETFQASLALALALSRQMSTMSTAGSTKLEAIFLDEGFGTLDAETLDEVAITLENLASSGSRMVGVVTHVAALAERIPVQFRVSRDEAGSRVEMVRA